MTDLPDSYEADSVETKWRAEWQEMDGYEYEDSGSPDYGVHTPPPYPTGNPHIRNALGGV